MNTTRSRIPPWGVLAVGAMVFLGCASSGTGSSPTGGSSSRNVITRAQMEELSLVSAYEAVRRLNPAWLRPRMTSSGQPAPIRVYVDNVRAGEISYLDQVHIDIIERLVYYSPSDATTKWGTGNSGGAIQVITRR